MYALSTVVVSPFVQRAPRAFLWDVQESAIQIQKFVADQRPP
jgi:hypothetical protein